MSVAADFRALMLAWPEVVALVDTRVALNASPQGLPLPVVVFTVSGTPEYTLSGQLISYAPTIEAQCWAETGASAQAVADKLDAALAADNPRRGWVIGRASGYDSDTDLHAEILNIEWWVDT